MPVELVTITYEITPDGVQEIRRQVTATAWITQEQLAGVSG
jgi:hypothetical protein